MLRILRLVMNQDWILNNKILNIFLFLLNFRKYFQTKIKYFLNCVGNILFIDHRLVRVQKNVKIIVDMYIYPSVSKYKCTNENSV